MPQPHCACPSPKCTTAGNPHLHHRGRALIFPTLNEANKSPAEPGPEACCPEAETCPLSTVAAGTTVCIKQLAVQPDVVNRLREMGMGEEQRIRLISRHPSLICQVCNARVALSQELAKAILVEPLRRTG